MQCRGLTYLTFNDGQKEIFDGLMLGDGYLAWRGNNCCFGNTDVHEEYLVWLQKQLGVEDVSSVKPHYVDGVACKYLLITRVIPALQNEYKRWYPNGAGVNKSRHYKIIPKDIELTPIKILFWFLGDGGYRNYEYEKNAWFYNNLIFDDWLILSKNMCKVLGADSGISIYKSRKDNYGIQRYIIRLNRTITKKFFDMVDSLGFDIPDCYQYKFGR